MRLLTSFSISLICSAALAQVPPPSSTAPPPPPEGGVQQGPQPGSVSGPGSIITQRSRVRAFNAAPDGQVRSVYLGNGTVVDLTGFGSSFGSQIRKGNRISVTGVRTIVNGQTIVVPQQLTLGQQSFTPMPNPVAAPWAGLAPQPYGQPPVRPGGPGMPPPPPGGPGAPPPPPPPPGGPGAPRPPAPAGSQGTGPATPGAPRGAQPPQPGVSTGAPVPSPQL